MNGNLAFHMVVVIDSVANAFASLISASATRDFQVEANSATAFAGRMSTRSIGDSYNLTGGAVVGTADRFGRLRPDGAGTARVLITAPGWDRSLFDRARFRALRWRS